MLKRHKHGLSHTRLTSCNQGELVPVGCVEVLPGDTFRHKLSAMIRMAPLVAPVMHPIEVRFGAYFCPTRLVMDDFEDFITGGLDGADSTTFPYIDFSGTNVLEGSLANRLGVPTGTNPGSNRVDAIRFRAYSLICNEEFFDQQLDTMLTVSTASGADSTTNTALQSCRWEKDPFTSLRPQPQLGAAITIPLGTSAPVESVAGQGQAGFIRRAADDSLMTGTSALQQNSGQLQQVAGPDGGYYDPRDTLQADLSNAVGPLVTDFRLSMAMARYQEIRNRYGSRYSEWLRYYGVRSSDGRLDRPEYLGGGKDFLKVSEVLQTGVDSADEGVGNMLGHGLAMTGTRRFVRYFEEHGYMIVLMWVRPRTIYAQGLHESLNRRTKEDFWTKELENVGQRVYLNKEIYAPHATPDGTFGYGERYGGYRRLPSQVDGEFLTTLDHWHMARLFTSDPALNSSFVTCNPTDRIYQSTATDQLYVYLKHSLQARRLVSPVGGSGGRI